MLLLGILASSKPAAAGDFESIATVTVGSGGSKTVSFSSIAATYTHLELRVIARSDRASSVDYYGFRFNSDTGSNYSKHYVGGDGSATEAGATANASTCELYHIPAASATASIFGADIIDIVDYANTNKYKTVRTLTGNDRNGAGRIDLFSHSWRNTNAINEITITCGIGNFVQYSHFALYGIKGA
jgi:hypothetical protein